MPETDRAHADRPRISSAVLNRGALMAALMCLCAMAQAQIFQPPLPPPPGAATSAAPAESTPPQSVRGPGVYAPTRIPRPPDAPKQGYVDVMARTQDIDPPWRHFRGLVRIETTDMMLTADSVDFNNDTGDAYLQGNVHYVNFITGESLNCARAEYNLDRETGTFHTVAGELPPRIFAHPGTLTTTNPFHFEGEFARKYQDRYVIYRGWVTDCTMPHPWWRLTGPKFDIEPGQRAITYRSWFKVRRVPIFWSPYFYKTLKHNPRQSGLMAPSIGHSTLMGWMYGGGGYWAINQGQDLSYELRDFSLRGLAHTAGYRARIKPGTVIDLGLYALNDRGLSQDNGLRQYEGGYLLTGEGRADLGNGWYARGNLDFLSSFVFQQAFSMSFTQAISAETQSAAFIAKHWSSYGFTLAASRVQDYGFDPSINMFAIGSSQPCQAVGPNTYSPGTCHYIFEANQSIVTKKMPEADFNVHEKQINDTILPFWFSLDSSLGLLNRSQPAFAPPDAPPSAAFQTSLFMPRLDIYPHLTTALKLGDFTLVPSFSVRETEYGQSTNGAATDFSAAATGTGTPPAGSPPTEFALVNRSLLRSAREFQLDLQPPSLERIYGAPKWLGTELKHVIEPRVSYHYVDGIGTDALNVIRFDDADVMNDTNEMRFSLTNRLFVKKKDKKVDELLNWELDILRYFDPTFGGALLTGQRNVLWSTLELTGFDFLSGPRNWSPVASRVTWAEWPVQIVWRADYNPVTLPASATGFGISKPGIVYNEIQADYHTTHYGFSFGTAEVKEDPLTMTIPVLSPSSNQLHGSFNVGNQVRRGWNAGMNWYYDVKKAQLNYVMGQVTYNTDCCGFSVEFRHLDFGPRYEEQILAEFTIANVGGIGTLPRQARIF